MVSRLRRYYEQPDDNFSVESDGANSVFYSNIRIDSDKPLLVLENVEDHIVDITCQPNFIELKFPSEGLRDSAKSTCRELIGSYVITSHIGCNDEGERNAYRCVSSFRYRYQGILSQQQG